MARRREMDVFSWSFLDAITCGFGAVVLTFVIISAQVSSNAEHASADLRAKPPSWEDEVLDARKNLVRLQNSHAEQTMSSSGSWRPRRSGSRTCWPSCARS